MNIIDRINLKLREMTNRCFGYFRQKKAHAFQGEPNHNFTIISNNCWGGHVYRYFNLPYNSPTVGLYIFSDDYLKFLKDLKHYLSLDLVFIPICESKHYLMLKKRATNCPIARLDDIEIIFLHYKSEEEALSKWKRRTQRINWNHIIVKLSEQNECSFNYLKEFDSLDFKTKFVFVHKDYGLNSQIVFPEWKYSTEVTDDITRFRKYIDLIALVSGRDFKK